MKKIESKLSLNQIELLNFANFLKNSRTQKEYFYKDSEFDANNLSILNNLFSQIYTNSIIEENILSKIIDENTIDNHASSNLYSIRIKIHSVEQSIKEQLNYILHSTKYSKCIQDFIVTTRNSRYVIPIKEEYRSQFKGFIHDSSSSGSTLYIEPISIFELNNELNKLKKEEAFEIDKILLELSKLLFNIEDKLHSNINIIGQLDFIFAKANLALKMNAIKPTLNDEKIINLIQAKHPLIDEKNVVPIDIILGKKYSTLVITRS